MARTSTIKSKPKGKKKPGLKALLEKSSTLTLRLDAQQTTTLSEISKLLQVGSGAGTISRMIMTYKSLHGSLERAEEFGDKMNQYYWDLRDAMDQKAQIEAKISKLLKNEMTSGPRNKYEQEKEDEDDF